MKSRLKQILKKHDIKQEELADMVGATQSYISLVVNDKKPNITLKMAQKISKTLGYPTDYIWPN